MSTPGIVSRLKTRALRLAPDHPVARYYSALALLGAGRADLALTIWQRLAEQGSALEVVLEVLKGSHWRELTPLLSNYLT